MFNKLPELTKEWWPVVTSIMVIISLSYTGLTYIIHTESKNIIKSDVLPHYGFITITGNSAYANGWASKWYKSKGGSWKSTSKN